MGWKVMDQLQWGSSGPGIWPVLSQFGLTYVDYAVMAGIARWEHDATADRVRAGELKENSPDAIKGWCYASQGRLAVELSLSQSTVSRSLVQLVAGGFVDEVVRKGFKGGKYRRINPRKLAEMIAAVGPAMEAYKARFDSEDLELESIDVEPATETVPALIPVTPPPAVAVIGSTAAMQLATLMHTHLGNPARLQKQEMAKQFARLLSVSSQERITAVLYWVFEEEIGDNQWSGWADKIIGAKDPVDWFIQKYPTIEGQFEREERKQQMSQRAQQKKAAAKENPYQRQIDDGRRREQADYEHSREFFEAGWFEENPDWVMNHPEWAAKYPQWVPEQCKQRMAA